MTHELQASRYLICQADSFLFAIEIASIAKILPLAQLTQAATRSAFFVGFLNLHGESVPIIDLLSFVGQERTGDYSTDTVMIICSHQDKKVGLIVDKIFKIITAQVSQVGTGDDRALYLGTLTFEDQVVAVLNVHTVFDKQQVLSAT